MFDLAGIDVEEIATAPEDQTDYEHRWLLEPKTSQLAFWTSTTGIDGENPDEIDELDLSWGTTCGAPCPRSRPVQEGQPPVRLRLPIEAVQIRFEVRSERGSWTATRTPALTSADAAIAPDARSGQEVCAT